MLHGLPMYISELSRVIQCESLITIIRMGCCVGLFLSLLQLRNYTAEKQICTFQIIDFLLLEMIKRKLSPNHYLTPSLPKCMNHGQRGGKGYEGLMESLLSAVFKSFRGFANANHKIIYILRKSLKVTGQVKN